MIAQAAITPSAMPAGATAGALDIPVFADVLRAADRIAGVAHRTPVITSRTADALADATLFFKCENLQRGGAFKFRGGLNAIRALKEKGPVTGVIAFSSGNHAQAIALAGRLENVPTVIVMPADAPAMKVVATRGYGAEVVFYDRYTEDREAIGRRLADERGLALVPPFDYADVIAGQGTAALELIDEVGPLDLLVAPLGGGGLLAGSALVAYARSPGCQVYGVEPEAGDDGRRSFQAGHIVKIPVPVSIADGALTAALGQRTFPIIQGMVTDIVTVSDPMLVETMRFFLERLKMAVEPTGCLGAAAAMNGVVPVAGKRVGIIISGGNVDSRVMASLLA
jgi:threonine dehydratase